MFVDQGERGRAHQVHATRARHVHVGIGPWTNNKGDHVSLPRARARHRGSAQMLREGARHMRAMTRFATDLASMFQNQWSCAPKRFQYKIFVYKQLYKPLAIISNH